MLLIPIGLIFIFFAALVGGYTVGLVINAGGYILIAINAFKFRGRSYWFDKVFYMSVALAVYSVAVRLWAPQGMLGIGMSLLELLLQLVFLYLLVRGVMDLEKAVKYHLNTYALNLWRKYLSYVWGGVFALSVAQYLAPVVAVASFIVLLAWVILCVIFIVVWFRTNHRYGLILKKEKIK